MNTVAEKTSTDHGPILIVEDDADLREMMAQLLTLLKKPLDFDHLLTLVRRHC